MTYLSKRLAHIPMNSIRFYLVFLLLILTCCNNIGSKKTDNRDNIVPT